MSSIFTEMDSLHKETQQEQNELTRLCGKLARESIAFHDEIGFPQNQDLFDKMIKAREDYSQSSERLAVVKSAINEISEGDTTITNGRVRLKELDQQRQKMLSVLGAVAAEVYDSGNLTEDLDFAIAPLKTYRKEKESVVAALEASASPISRLFLNHKKKTQDKKLETVYGKIGALIADSGERGLLPGPRAEAIFIELGNIEKMKDNLTSEINRRNEKISIARTSVNNLRVREVELECDRLLDLATSAEEAYGQFLVSQMDSWLNDDCPIQIIKCCDNIRLQKRKIYLQQLHARLLSFEKAIEICEGRISQYNDRIEYLDTQIDTLQAQKGEMLTKIEAERQNIESCRIQQKAIKGLAKESK